MRILIATDKFKDALPAIDVCNGLKNGILQSFPDAVIETLPLADGGEGTLDALQNVLGGEFVACEVNDSLFRKIKAHYLFIKSSSTAVVEMARASGIELLAPTERNCLHTTSLGTGELILHAIESGAENIILTVGGTATNDAGIGMATALGYKFLAVDDRILEPIGKNLEAIKAIDRSNVHPLLSKINFTIATDVTNPFYGENGAAQVFAPQKGADENAVCLLDNGLAHFSGILQQIFQIDVQLIKGSGAGGGMGGGAACFLNAKIESAADWILSITQIPEKLKHSNVLITGEGKIDTQSWQGKLLSRLLYYSSLSNTKVVLVCGTLQDVTAIAQNNELLYATSILNAPVSLQQALEQSPQLIYQQGLMLGKLLKNVNI